MYSSPGNQPLNNGTAFERANAFARDHLKRYGFIEPEDITAIPIADIRTRFPEPEHRTIAAHIATLAREISHSPTSEHRLTSFQLLERSAQLDPSNGDYPWELYKLLQFNITHGLWKDLPTREQHDAELLREAKAVLESYSRYLKQSHGVSQGRIGVALSSIRGELKAALGSACENSCHTARFLATFLSDRRHKRAEIDPYAATAESYLRMLLVIHGLPANPSEVQRLPAHEVARIPAPGRERVARALISTALSIRATGDTERPKVLRALASTFAPALVFDPKLPPKSDPALRKSGSEAAPQASQPPATATPTTSVAPALHKATLPPIPAPSVSVPDLPTKPVPKATEPREGILEVTDGFSFSEHRADWLAVIGKLSSALWATPVEEKLTSVRSPDVCPILMREAETAATNTRLILVGGPKVAELYRTEILERAQRWSSTPENFVAAVCCQAVCESLASSIQLTLETRNALRSAGKVCESRAKLIGGDLRLGHDHTVALGILKRAAIGAFQLGK